ncbi:MAG: thiaminase II [Sulfobacillus sp.]
MDRSFSHTLKENNQDVWESIMTHPFVVDMGRGTLSDERLSRFIAQDYQYLKDFFRVLAVAAAKAPTNAWRAIFTAHAQNVVAVERQLHLKIAPLLDVSVDELQAIEPLPITIAYTDHLLRIAWTESFEAIVAAVLPCYWTYREIGIRLGDLGLPDHPLLRDWIETYRGPLYGQSVEEVLGIADALTLNPVCHMAFERSLRYERLFWSQGYGMNESGFLMA